MKQLFFFFFMFFSLSAKEYKAHSYGIEINPFRPLWAQVLEGPSFSGSFNYFDHKNAFEITLPITYNQSKIDRYWYTGYAKKYSFDEKVLNVDIHLRKYFMREIKEVYLGVFTRYTYLEGKLKNDYRLAGVHKFGVGTEVGFRVMHIFGSNFFYGASIGIGRYFSAENDIFEKNSPAMFFDDRITFIDFELLKIGYEF